MLKLSEGGSMRRLAFFVILLSVFVAVPAQAQFTASYILSPTPNSEFSIMAGPSWQPIKIGSFRAGGGVMAGLVLDKADPLYRGDRHGHLGLMPNVSGTYYLTNWLGATVGYGRTLLYLNDPKPHVPNSNSWFVGATFGGR